jgi:uncharacterized protein
MKYLFWLLVLALLWWVYRRNKGGTHPAPPADTPPASQQMVVCTHCGVHLPHDEAVSGTHGHYCSTAHRSAAGDRNPD